MNLNFFQFLKKIKESIISKKEPIDNNPPNNLYTVIPVSRAAEYVNLEDTLLPMVDIILKTRDLNELPYSDVLNDHNPIMQEAGITREIRDRVTLRGDDRGEKDIRKAGGFYPNWTNPMAQNETCDPLDIIKHRENSTGSGFVSTTIDPEEAHWYGTKFAKYHQYGRVSGADLIDKEPVKYNIYAVNAIGALEPTPSPSPNETEFSVPGGIDAEDIIAYRECQAKLEPYKTFTKCSDVFFNQRYKEKYPQLLEPIVNAMLMENESIKYKK